MASKITQDVKGAPGMQGNWASRQYAAAQNVTMAQLKEGAMSVGEQDTTMWKLITDVPRVYEVLACLAAFLNLILPGTGTVLVGCLGDRNDGGELSKT